MSEKDKTSQIISHEVTEEPIKTLVIDDSQAFRRMIALMLQNCGLNVAGEASTGLEGVALYEKLRTDVVFLDVIMPTISGMEVLKRIKTINPRAIVVILTSIAERENVIESKKAGAFAYVLKPFDFTKIERLVNEIKRKIAQEMESNQD